MKSNKAHGGLIIIILIVLLILAVIVIVLQVVFSVTSGEKNPINNQANCMGLNIVVTKATNASNFNVVVRRDPGTNLQNNVTVVVFLNGANNYTLTQTLKELDSNTSTLRGLKFGDKLQVAAKLPDGTACPLSAETLVGS